MSTKGLKLFEIGILNRWFSSGLTTTIVLTVSKSSGSSVSSVSKSICMLLVVLLRLTLLFTSFPVSMIVVLDLVVASVFSFSDDVLMRLTDVGALLRLVQYSFQLTDTLKGGHL